MSCLAKPENAEADRVTRLNPDVAIPLGEFLEALAIAPEAPLILYSSGMSVGPGYHVTEVKAADYISLDCGAAEANWRETIVQILDAGCDDDQYMKAGKFRDIVLKVSQRLSLAMNQPLTFEVSNGREAMRIFAATRPSFEEDIIAVRLVASAARCKPALLAMAQPTPSQEAPSACCSASSVKTSACCQG
jgi:Family of unknown function (DUF6428)